MIKLFWNTHNEVQSLPDSHDNKDATSDFGWGIYHKNNSDKWIYSILCKVNFDVIENLKDLKQNDILIIVDSSIHKKNKLYEKIKLTCSKIFLIHLGDESGIHDLSPVYNNCSFIWRTFCSNKYFNNERINCLPLGYKSGTIYQKNTNIKKYKWAFIGTPHKSSRHDLLFQLSDIHPSYNYKTKKFNDKIMQVHEMNKILSSTDFVPCPNGFVHPETYRLYESLECDCIPIVENTYKYYDRLFPDNPFLKVDTWKEAKSLIKEFSDEKIKNKKSECKIWWNKYKNQIQQFIKNKIRP